MPVIPYKTGVYCILNKRTGKRYIGSAAKSLDKRLWSHKYYLRLGVHKNLHLQRAWNIDKQHFVFIILERCSPAKCVEREQYWIDYYKSSDRTYGYNKSPTAGSPLGVIHTTETRQKLSAIHKGRKKSAEHAANIRKGKQNVSAATRQKMSAYTRNRSASHRKRLSDAMKGKTNCLGRVVTAETRRKLAEKSRLRWAVWKKDGTAKLIAKKIQQSRRRL